MKDLLITPDDYHRGLSQIKMTSPTSGYILDKMHAESI